MRVTELRTFLAHPGGKRSPFVPIATDAGLLGRGACHTRADRDPIDREPAAITHVTSAMGPSCAGKRGAMASACARSGIARALRDIVGKAAGRSATRAAAPVAAAAGVTPSTCLRSGGCRPGRAWPAARSVGRPSPASPALARAARRQEARHDEGPAPCCAGGNNPRTAPTPSAARAFKVVGADLASIGRFEPSSAAERVIALEEAAEHRHRKLVLDRGRIAGAILCGYPQDAPVDTATVEQRIDVGPHVRAIGARVW